MNKTFAVLFGGIVALVVLGATLLPRAGASLDFMMACFSGIPLALAAMAMGLWYGMTRERRRPALPPRPARRLRPLAVRPAHSPIRPGAPHPAHWIPVVILAALNAGAVAIVAWARLFEGRRPWALVIAPIGLGVYVAFRTAFRLGSTRERPGALFLLATCLGCMTAGLLALAGHVLDLEWVFLIPFLVTGFLMPYLLFVRNPEESRLSARGRGLTRGVSAPMPDPAGTLGFRPPRA
jgi:hypothetical protein